MRKRGRPKGSGYDDVGVIGRVLALMVAEGLSRRSAIIRICGLDQLRRIEVKMSACARDLTTNWRRTMDADDRDGADVEARDVVQKSVDGTKHDEVGYYELAGFSELIERCRALGFSLLYASDAPAAA